MTQQELHQQRAKNWRLDGNPVLTLEEARDFLENVGFCLLFPMRSLPLVPTLIGACAGSDADLPDAKHAFADARTGPATELLARLGREKSAYEINFNPETPMVAAASMFPYFYALTGDRNPKAAPKKNLQGAPVSPLAAKVFETIEKHGPLTTGRLQELISRELTVAALERALGELWSILKITRVDVREGAGATWELLYRWEPKAIKKGLEIAVPEALSALLGKYLESAVAVSQEDIEQLFSQLTSRSKIREVVHALLAARQLSLMTMGAKTLIQIAQEGEASGHRNIGKSGQR